MASSITHDEFERLFRQHARGIFAHVRALVPHGQDAEEVFQETSATLWARFDQYQPNTDFRAWACRIAYYKVLKLRERQHRAPRLFSNEFLETVDEELIVMSDSLDARSAALDECRKLLNAADRDLLEDHYARGASAAEIAARLRRSADAVYRRLRRIHRQLHACIQAKLEGVVEP